MLIFRRIHCIHAVYGTLTLYEISWLPFGAQFEGELQFSLKLCTDRPPRILVESDSTIYCMYTVYPLEDEHLRLVTRRGT